MARTTSDYPGSLDTFINATTDFNPGDAIPSSDFERGIDAIKTIQTKLGITGGTALLDSAVTVNNSEADKDFRIAAVGATNAFFVQGSDGAVSIEVSLATAILTATGAVGFDGGAFTFNTSEADKDFRIAAVGATNAFFVQGSDGKVGIGTAVIPHGGEGYAMLAIEGADDSAAGPHVQFTTDADDYPLIQIFPLQRDNMGILFDAYFDGDWKSSDAGSNFMIYKSADKFAWYYDSGVAQGGTVTWNHGLELEPDGGIFMDNLLQQSAAGLVVEYDATTKELYAETSATKFKKDIRDLDLDTSKLLDLVPKSYIDKETGRQEFGLIAEEVAEIIPEVVVFDEENKPLGIKFTRLPIVMLNEIKKLDARLQVLEV